MATLPAVLVTDRGPSSPTVIQFLIAHGDSRQPLPETIRVLDEILTEFIQGVSFEASRVAQLAGRQKVKYEDFQFAMRKNPVFLGKAAENKELREILEKQRKTFTEEQFMTDDPTPGGGAAASGSGTGKGRKRAAPTGDGETTNGQTNGSGANGPMDEEELGDADDDEIEQLMASGNRKA